MPVVRCSFSHGCSVPLVVTLGCSFPTSWRCVPRCCFCFVFDSAGSARVVFFPTLVVGRGITLFRSYVVLYSRYEMLTTSAVQTLSGFSPALISNVTRFVTVFAVTFYWSVGDEDLGFPILAGSLGWVERMLFAVDVQHLSVDQMFSIFCQARKLGFIFRYCQASLFKSSEFSSFLFLPTEPRRVQTPEISMQLACTWLVPSAVTTALLGGL
ncbi:hypothetical protein Taro_055229 [Colocasia esculenta]|uniref:Uncharacterized protein n=1 Tax=Colocasia esculenta TaxID=4460 RepID=A0A843XSY8_COLES|nr:hypothetical protein [Colocasia esculenta]